jgi:hypothetical protein
VVVPAVLAAAAISAVSIPLDRPGLGWLVSALAATVALVVSTWSTARSDTTGVPDRAAAALPAQPAQAAQPARPVLGVDRVVWTAATGCLLGVGTLRAAGWLFVLCVLTAGMTACLAVAGGRSVRGLLFSGVIPTMAVFRSVPWLVTGLRRAGRAGGSSVGRGLLTVAVSLGLLIVFGSLFASADTVFADLLGDLLPELSAGTVVRWIFLVAVLGAGLSGAAYVLAAPPDLSGLDQRSARRVRRLEWAFPVALLDLLFAAFVLVQLTVLFGGSEHVLGKAGPTYAQYARGGFWQLLAVSALTLLVIGAAARWAPRAGRADRLLIRALLGALALLSLVVVSSALVRMNVYTQAYGATRLRLVVAACELWLGLVFVLILVAGVRLRGGWLPRLVLGTAVLALFGLVAVNPDRLIADRNIDRYAETGRLDVGYLARLSADAAPELDRLPPAVRDCALISIAYDLRRQPDDWRELNLGRARARQVLDATPISRTAADHCWIDR